MGICLSKRSLFARLVSCGDRHLSARGFLMGQRFLALALIATFAAEAPAVNPASWDIVDLTTTGNDVHYESPTTVTTGLAEYQWTYDVSKVEVQATLVIFPTWIDITSRLEEGGVPLSGGEIEPGLPFVLLDEVVNESGTQATFLVEVDATGRGRASITDVVLGEFSGIDITGVRASLNFTVTGYPFGDYDRDRDVDSADYSLWRETAGLSTDLRADGNRDSVVNAADYVVWRDNLGTTAGVGSGNVTAIPEPSGLAILLIFGGSIVVKRRRFNV
jgi:hypothetical protein